MPSDLDAVLKDQHQTIHAKQSCQTAAGELPIPVSQELSSHRAELWDLRVILHFWLCKMMTKQPKKHRAGKVKMLHKLQLHSEHSDNSCDKEAHSECG